MTSFRATLEEVERAEILLHVRDASSPMVEEQKVQVERVLPLERRMAVKDGAVEAIATRVTWAEASRAPFSAWSKA